MDAMLRGLFGGSVGHIEITGKRNGKTDEEIAEIVDKTIKDIISGMAGVELEERKDFLTYELKSAHIFCDSCPDRKLYQSSQEAGYNPAKPEPCDLQP